MHISPLEPVHYKASNSKSSSLSRYFMMLRLILDESTQVTKSSMFLAFVSQKISCVFQHSLPRNKIRWVRDNRRTDPDMPLLNHLNRARQMLAHAQPRHNHRQPPPCKCTHSDLVLDVTQLSSSSTTRTQDTHIEQLLEQQILLFPAEWVCRVKIRDTVCELAQRAAQLVVFSVVVAALDGVAAHDKGLAVVVVRFISVEIDLAEQLLLMMLKFARHLDGRCGGFWCFEVSKV